MFQAGIDGELLSIALEPEAASLYCQLTHGEDVSVASKSARLSLASPGIRYMVIDLGGMYKPLNYFLIVSSYFL